VLCEVARWSGKHPDFRRLWIGSTISQFGTQVSMLAVPLVAVVTLHASTFQIGLLTALENCAFLIIGLPAGAWVDRMPRRPVLIVADLLRAALLVSVPVAALIHVLTLGQLYLVVFVLGAVHRLLRRGLPVLPAVPHRARVPRRGQRQTTGKAELGYQIDVDDVRRRLTALPTAHVVFAATHRNRVVGWLHAFHSHSLLVGDRVEIAGVAVATDWQSQGVGTALITRVERWSIARGVRAIYLRSGSERRAAHQFYRRRGYKQVKTQQAFTKALVPG
jgi:GNAT superfamily N-acetyltransferase